MDKRERRIVRGFLVGSILIEGAALIVIFRNDLTAPDRVEHYLFSPPGNLTAWAMATVISAAYLAYAAVGSPLIRAHMLAPWKWGAYAGMRLLAVPLAFVVGVFEEVFFRKILMDFVAHRGLAAPAQVALSGIAFGLAHGMWGLFSGRLQASLAPMIATGVLGALLALVYLVGERSVAPCIAAHVVMNLLLEPWLVIAAITNSWGPQPGSISASDKQKS